MTEAPINPTRDRHIRRFRADYASALSLLLPQGLAWPRDPDSVVMKTTKGLSGIYEYIDGRAADLLEIESDPRITSELLTDWERNWDLPDTCMPVPITEAERRIALVTKMTFLGRQDREFFAELAATLGVEIDIREYSPWMFGVSEFGKTRDLELQYWHWEIASPRIRFYWTVWVGDPSPDMECLFNRYKPAFTRAVFNYTRVVVPHVNLVFTNYVPSVVVGFPHIIPGGNIAFSSSAPTINYTKLIEVPTAGLWLRKAAPAYYNPSVEFEGPGYPPQGNVAFGGFAPTVGVGRTHDVPAKQLALSTTAPEKEMGGRGYPPKVELTISAFAPMVSIFHRPDAAQLGVTTTAPTIAHPKNLFRTPGAGQGIVTGTAPTVARTASWIFSPTRKSTRISLSSTKLTATLNTADGNYHNAFADPVIVPAARKRYAEFTMDAFTFSPAFGLATNSASVTNDNYWLGQDALSMGAWADGTVYKGGTQLGYFVDYPLGQDDIICVAYDETTGNIWFRRLAYLSGSGGLYGIGPWNNDWGVDPSSGSSVFNISSLGASLIVGTTLRTVGDSVFGNYVGSFEADVPTGFSAWSAA